ncbi:hypothetical protein LTR48_003410 [Friedmanniomyces endolithicus]|uniref:SnoaL-like domain-containing protein n=2 Tax=Dothideomycetidae TaxID=451867 RepID=A0AAN6IZL0_9PEZI|nr:hypothetical protein LTR82_017311 [Friedmanniomyces endolithicus]KAK1043100.1 hypothetical protein LTR74_018468 [Friedmanniomyces endolithicus]KAK1086595.1 hypothetical protein LTR48_003410 [Friedmanniomyces endolithicus]KAK5147765.1 hypothetical protein LTR32_000824 [Rachicladosporium monterosium]
MSADSIVETVRAMISTYHKQQTTEEFLSRFAPDVAWYDHAFLVQRVGHEAVVGLLKAFLHCNQPFETKIKSIELAQSGVVVAEIVWHGRAVNDIVRPDGEVAVKATGQAFECHVCMLIRVNDDKKICRLDEYYNRKWDDGIAEEKYLLMKGKSIRD